MPQRLCRQPQQLHVLLAVVLLAAAVQDRRADTPQTMFVGQIQEAAVHRKEAAVLPPRGGKGGGRAATAAAPAAPRLPTHERQYFLRLRTGELRHLRFPRKPAEVPRSGTWVAVAALPSDGCDPPAAPGALCVGSLMAHEDAPRDVFAPGQPRGAVDVKALVMQLQVCGQGPATTPEKLSAALFDDEPGGSQEQTVEGMFRSCSYGAARFGRAQGTQVLTAVVPIPCSGKTPWNVPYDSAACPFTEWSDVANQYVREVLGLDWESFKHKVYVVPPGELCSWGGMGWVGCKVDCRAWISGDLWEYPTTWLHELGHNLYLNHAGSYQPSPGGGGASEYVAYRDDSGAMGHCCSTRCFNAPHSFQLGWSRPVDVLHQGNLPVGLWRSYTLPPRSGPRSSAANMLRVRGDWSPQAAGFNIFIEYRRGEGYDAGLYPSVRGKVTLYSTPAGDSMPYTTFEAALGENQIGRETRLGSNLTVWVGAAGERGAAVHVCRPSGAVEEDCSDGCDDDCDGLTDAEDPGLPAARTRWRQRRQRGRRGRGAQTAAARGGACQQRGRQRIRRPRRCCAVGRAGRRRRAALATGSGRGLTLGWGCTGWGATVQRHSSWVHLCGNRRWATAFSRTGQR